VHQPKAFHEKLVEMMGQDQLVLYVFSNGRPDSLVRLRIYSKESEFYTAAYETFDATVERILVPSGLWLESYGRASNVLVDTFEQGLSAHLSR